MSAAWPWKSVLPAESARTVFSDLDVHGQGFLGKQPGHVLRPFDQAERTAVEIIVEPDVESLFLPGDAIEVEMVDRIPRSGGVFVDYCEGGELTASEQTPRQSQRALMNVVLPAPIGA